MQCNNALYYIAAMQCNAGHCKRKTEPQSSQGIHWWGAQHINQSTLYIWNLIMAHKTLRIENCVKKEHLSWFPQIMLTVEQLMWCDAIKYYESDVNDIVTSLISHFSQFSFVENNVHVQIVNFFQLNWPDSFGHVGLQVSSKWLS